MVSAGVRDVLILTGAVGVYGAGQEKSIDAVLLNVVVSLSGTDRSSISLYSVPCSGDDTTLDAAMQTSRTIKLWETRHGAIALASEKTRCNLAGNFPRKSRRQNQAGAEGYFMSEEAIAFYQALGRVPQAP